MKQAFAEIIGYIAAVLTTIAYLPQTLKTIRSRKTKDISLNMYLLMFTGVSGWLVYGIHLDSLPMIFANSLTLTLVITIIVLKLRYK
jgi:MtN3 and saliva related transmembrane protein